VPNELEVAAMSNDTPSPTPCRGASKSASGLTKRTNGAGTRHTNQKPAGVAMARSMTCDWTKGNDAAGDSLPMSVTTCTSDHAQHSTAVVIEGLRPRQVIAASLLASGRKGTEVAATLNVAVETVSRWKAEPAFQGLMRQLVQEQINSVQLGMISLTSEAITHLHHLINSFSDQTSLKACALVLGKIGPVLNVVGSELRRPQAMEDRPPQ